MPKLRQTWNRHSEHSRGTGNVQNSIIKGLLLLSRYSKVKYKKKIYLFPVPHLKVHQTITLVMVKPSQSLVSYILSSIQLISTIDTDGRIDLSVSPSPRTQTSQWQSSISCTGSGTRTSLSFSPIEKRWKIRSLHQFYGGFASKMEKLCAWGTCNTDSRYPERLGNIIYFITFPESISLAKCP